MGIAVLWEMGANQSRAPSKRSNSASSFEASHIFVNQKFLIKTKVEYFPLLKEPFI